MLQKQVLSSIVLIAASISLANGDVVNYCDAQLCNRTEYQHITCTATGDFTAECPKDARAIVLTKVHIQRILDNHNKYRNIIAGGNEPGFNQATRMSTIVSDFE